VSETFGQWLQARRKERSLTLRDVRAITNGRLSDSLLSQIETGRVKSPTIKSLHLISAALGLDFAQVCGKAAVGERVATPDFCPTCGQVIR
jgi:transcriptional regulator with XRE-family HTH domain